MSDQGGGDRPRWEGFPGGVEPDDGMLEPAFPPQDPTYATPSYDTPVPDAGYPDPAFPAYQGGPAGADVPPQFPVQPLIDETAPIPVIAAGDPYEGATPPAGGGGDDGDGLGPRSAARARSGPRQDTSRLVAIACAVAVLLVGSGFAFVACNNDEVSPQGNAPAPVVSLTTPTASPTPTVSRTPSRTASATASASASASASRTPSASPSAIAAAVKQPLVVLNSTAIVGLAARVAKDIEAGGWTVTDTTNWRGAQPGVTTIYYLPGAKNKASAKLFAEKFGVAKAVKPALPGMTSNLTLVLTRDAS